MASMVTETHISRLRSLVKGKVMPDEPMRNHTSFKIGGPADVLCQPYDAPSLKAVLKYAWEEGLPVFALGNGTNLLVADEGIRGVVLKLSTGFDYVRFDGCEVTAGAGASLPALAKACGDKGLSGLEFAVGIPGSLGGALTMNAGAYSSTVGDVTKDVRAIATDGTEVVRSKAEMQFAHRGSRLSYGDLFAYEAVLVLKYRDRDTIHRKMQEYMNDRRMKQPLTLPSAGCVFQNPSGRGAGRYIDAAGLKGLRVGGAEVSLVHANFIVNAGGATARDVLMLMDIVRRTVFDKFGIELVPEVRVVGG